MSSDTVNEGGPAFPCFGPHDHLKGMTLRDYFAAQIRVAMGTWTPDVPGHLNYDQVVLAERKSRAEWAYAEADAMIAAREVES